MGFYKLGRMIVFGIKAFLFTGQTLNQVKTIKPSLLNVILGFMCLILILLCIT